jgi:recombination protein RecR
MTEPADPIEALIHHLSRLPGVGSKTAGRLGYHILRHPDLGADLAAALLAVQTAVRPCGLCGDVAASDPCVRCADPRRDEALLCVVERTPDLLAIDRSGGFRGRFHLLGGVLSPLDGVGPDALRIRELLARVGAGVTEVLVATNPTVEGDATALYLARLLKPLGVRVTRIARGISAGAELEYTDVSTLARAIDERREM